MVKPVGPREKSFNATEIDQRIKDIDWQISDMRFVGRKEVKYYEKAKDEFDLAKNAFNNSKLNSAVQKDLLKDANRFLTRAFIYLDASKHHYSQEIVKGMLGVHPRPGETKAIEELPEKSENIPITDMLNIIGPIKKIWRGYGEMPEAGGSSGREYFLEHEGEYYVIYENQEGVYTVPERFKPRIKGEDPLGLTGIATEPLVPFLKKYLKGPEQENRFKLYLNPNLSPELKELAKKTLLGEV